MRLAIAGVALRDGVVAFAGLNLQALAAVEADGAELAVEVEIFGRVAEQVLGAQFVLDLVEGLLKLFAIVANVDDAAAGVMRKLLHLAVAGVAEAHAGIEAAVGDQDHVDNGVGLLRGLGGGFECLFRALLAAVGQHDDDFAAGFGAQLVVRGEIDGVIKMGAADARVASHASGADAGVDAGFLHGALQLAGGAGVVGEQVYVDVKGDEEGFVLGLENILEEFNAGGLLKWQNVLLRAGGVEQDANGERQGFFLGEVFDDLRLFGSALSAFSQDAVVLFEVRDKAGLVAGGEVNVDEVGADPKGLEGADVGGRFGGGIGFGRRTGGAGSLLRAGRGQPRGGKEGSGGKCGKAHMGLDGGSAFAYAGSERDSG